MFRQDRHESRNTGLRGLAWAGATATLVTVVLVGAVALAWAVGRGPASSPAMTAQEPLTPTPRTLSFAQAAPSPTAAASAETAPVTIATEPPLAEAAEMVIVSTPALMTMSVEDGPAADVGVADFEATTESAFLDLATGSWSARQDALVNEGSHAVSERWLTIAPMSSENVAVEAEMRVTNILNSVCDQSFGIAIGSPEANSVFGAGTIFPCSGGDSLARLTDVTTWEDGYNQDAALAEASFKPGDDWRTYRFELRDGKLRLLVDGEQLLTSDADPGIDPVASDLEAGLWSQGVGLEIRRLAVYSIPG